MKKLIKMLSILVISILSFSIMTGCSDKVTPPETIAQGFFDMIVYNDTKTIESVGVSEDEIGDLKDFMSKTIKENTRNNFKISGLSVTDEELDKITEAQLNAMKKIKATITTESSDKQTAVVKIKTNYLKITEADNKIGDDTIAEVQAMGLTDQKEMLNQLSKVYIQKLIDGLNSLEPVDDTVEKTFAFTMKTVKVNGKDKKMWVPDNPTTLGKDISSMIAQ